MKPHKFLSIENPAEVENLVLPPITNKSPSPAQQRVGGDINLIMIPNHKRKGQFHLRSRSNAANVLAASPSKP